MKNLIIGDIHSSYDRLRNVLEKADFDKDNDNLYSTGDLCDRGQHPVETLLYLMGLPHFYPVAGNHDIWLYDALVSGNPDDWWMEHNGGWMTWRNVAGNHDKTLAGRVKDWIGTFPLIRILPNHIIVHGGLAGITDERQLEEFIPMTVANTYLPQDRYGSIQMDRRVELLTWDRDYIQQALGERHDRLGRILPLETERTIICGHTPLRKPFHSEQYHLTCIDTGSFVRDGHITVMNIDTGEFFQSDN